jgi:hypothetical protein
MKTAKRLSAAVRAQEKAKRIDRLLEAYRIVRKGTCPTCGTKLYRNMSLTGWWQCGHLGAEGFQREAGPHCDFQTFFDPTPYEQEAVIRQHPHDGAVCDVCGRTVNEYEYSYGETECCRAGVISAKEFGKAGS